MEIDTFFECPIEPHIIAPKLSLIPSEANIPRPKINQYKDVAIIRSINKAKFPVYLAAGKNRREKYAMKIFPSIEDEAQKYFKNEIRFASLNHPRIIRTLHFEQDKDILYKGEIKTVSFIVMEYAPHGDFFDFLNKNKSYFNEKLARTYFKQLIEGLEYLHNRGIAHLDIKLENLLVGENFSLKVADFDLSCFIKEKRVSTKGTRFYRAPELINGECKSPVAADIYSAGVILFLFQSGGIIPHAEGHLFEGFDLCDLLYNNNHEFWNKHCEIQRKSTSAFSRDFKELFNGMTKLNPKERFTISEIKASEWYNGEIYPEHELKDYFKACVGTK